MPSPTPNYYIGNSSLSKYRDECLLKHYNHHHRVRRLEKLIWIYSTFCLVNSYQQAAEVCLLLYEKASYVFAVIDAPL